MTWERRNPLLYNQEKAEVEERYPGLHFAEEGGLVLIRGSFPVLFQGQALDHYTIEIQLSKIILRNFHSFGKREGGFLTDPTGM